MIQPEYELYLLSIRMQGLLDGIDVKANGLIKSVRSINNFANNTAMMMEEVSPAAHERSVHNFNVVLNSLDKDTLELPIGSLSIEK